MQPALPSTRAGAKPGPERPQPCRPAASLLDAAGGAPRSRIGPAPPAAAGPRASPLSHKTRNSVTINARHDGLVPLQFLKGVARRDDGPFKRSRDHGLYEDPLKGLGLKQTANPGTWIWTNCLNLVAQSSLNRRDLYYHINTRSSPTTAAKTIKSARTERLMEQEPTFLGSPASRRGPSLSWTAHKRRWVVSGHWPIHSCGPAASAHHERDSGRSCSEATTLKRRSCPRVSTMTSLWTDDLAASRNVCKCVRGRQHFENGSPNLAKT